MPNFAPFQTFKDPGSTEDFTINWTSVASADPILASNWGVPAGLNMVSSTFNNTAAAVRLSGGVPGQTYQVVNSVTLTSGQVLVASILITMQAD